MAAYPIPNPQYGIYNQNNFTKNPTGQDGLTLDTAKLYFLQFPNAQTTQTEYLHDIGVSGSATFEGPVTFNDTVTYNQDIEYTQNVLVDGDVTIIGNTLCETGTFQDILTCEKGIDISTSPYGITFPDNTTQTTAFVEANYAQLNTDNTFLAPYQQTFAGNASTGISTAPIKITNGVTNEYCTLYLDANGSDVTLYTNQNPGGGLTVKGANTQSFTMNPMAVQDGTGCQFLNPVDMNGSSLSGLLNVYSDNTTITFRDSAVNPMLQLTTTGHTSYENLDMNTNTITNASSIKTPVFYVGDYGQVTNQTSLNPFIVVFANTYSNAGNSAQFYFQINNTSNVPVSPLQIFSDRINSLVDLNMNSNDISNANLLTSTATTQTYPNNTTSIATCEYVTTAINNVTPQDLSNYAQLNTATAQTFTGSNNFTGGLYTGNKTVSNTQQLTFSSTFTMNTFLLTNCTLISGSAQQTVSYPFAIIGAWFSNPFTISINSYVPVGDPLIDLQFQQTPFQFWPPNPASGTIVGQTNTGQTNVFNYTWGLYSGIPYIQIFMAYNVGTGSIITFNFASLGYINVK